MKGILTLIIFILVMTGLGGPLIMCGFMILGYISHVDHVRFLDLDWYYHLGFLFYVVLLLKILFRGSRSLATFLLSLFN